MKSLYASFRNYLAFKDKGLKDINLEKCLKLVPYTQVYGWFKKNTCFY